MIALKRDRTPVRFSLELLLCGGLPFVIEFEQRLARAGRPQFIGVLALAASGIEPGNQLLLRVVVLHHIIEEIGRHTVAGVILERQIPARAQPGDIGSVALRLV